DLPPKSGRRCENVTRRRERSLPWGSQWHLRYVATGISAGRRQEGIHSSRPTVDVTITAHLEPDLLPCLRGRRRVLLAALCALLAGVSGALGAGARLRANGAGVKVLTFAYRSHAGSERRAYLGRPAGYH